MKGTKILAAAVMCAMLTFGIGGTSSAAELNNDFSTLQVSEELAARHPEPPRRMPPPPPPRRDERPRGGDFGRMGGGDYGPRGDYRNDRDRDYDRPRNDSRSNSPRQVNVNVRRVTIRI